MKDIFVCTDCGTPIDRNEAFLTNALAFSCEDCFEEWVLQRDYSKILTFMKHTTKEVNKT